MTFIDVDFDFTTDSRGFWNGFWERKAGLGPAPHSPPPNIQYTPDAIPLR